MGYPEDMEEKAGVYETLLVCISTPILAWCMEHK